MLVKVNTGLSGTSRFRYKRLNLGKKNKAGDGNRKFYIILKPSNRKELWHAFSFAQRKGQRYE